MYESLAVRQSSPPPAEPPPSDEPRPLAADPLVGLVVADRYRILGPLGSGGMGVVYKVEHTRIGKLMAMKLLAGELSRDPSLVKRFKREALLASRLSHPNTVQVFDFGQADGLTYLVMELVPGEDLAKVVRSDGPMPVLRAARLVLQICGSLSEAHRAGIVHRDLKPENVLVVKGHDGKSEIAKVCDFGLAKLRESDKSNDVTGHGAVVGTPYYMSPEQIRGEDVDSRTDIYALGALLYRLLTGVPPFAGSNPMAVFAKHLTEEPVPPSARTPGLGIPRAVDAIVLKALAKKRDERYASVDEVQAELADVLRAGNVSSVDMLLDSGQIRNLAREAATMGMAETQVQAAGAGIRQAATRDEVAAYERSLARQRLLGQVLVALAVAALGVGAARGYALYSRPVPFQGGETEPNNTAAEANAVPFGTPVKGQIGKRQEPGVSDRDFFVYEVPAGVSFARLRTTALPNFATCTYLYRAGMRDPLARFCSGAPGRDLELPVLRVEPGRYLLAVLQDTDPHEDGPLLPVYENVSDDYVLEFGPTQADQSLEIEPNDGPSVAMKVAAGVEVRGALAFVRDEDMYCPDERVAGSVKWVVRDAVERPRDPGTAVEVTLDRGPLKEPQRVVVHRAGAAGKPDAMNLHSPYVTAPVRLDGASTAGCVRIKLVQDPWNPQGSRALQGSREPYLIRLEASP